MLWRFTSSTARWGLPQFGRATEAEYITVSTADKAASNDQWIGASSEHAGSDSFMLPVMHYPLPTTWRITLWTSACRCSI